jgi:pyruvate dehydrogenase E2 component (dihydrolipoamide acetyltransferase)
MNQIVAITMPKWGLEMTEGTLAAWHLPEGAAAAKGAELADIETAKIVNTLEVNEAGTLRRLVAKVGDTLPVGALLAVVAAAEVPETDIAAFINGFRPVGEAPPPAAAPPPAPAAPPNGESNATPVARRIAAELGIDLAAITGTGRNGRISQEDVETFAAARAAAPTSAPATDSAFSPFSSTRKAIAAALVRTVQTVPSYVLTMDVAMDKLLALRAELNARPGPKLSVNDFLIRAAALALAEVPEVNAHVSDDGIRPFAQANLSIAVASDAGVFMPVIRDAGAKTLWEIAAASASLAEKARARRLTAEDLADGSFSLSNLGMFGVRQFEALINAPQAAILAIGATRREAQESPSGVAFASVMSVTLACDHRAIDGALGAKFLNAFKTRIEQPLGLVLPA